VTHEITRREFLVTASCSLMPRVAGAAHGQSSSSWRAAVTELENLIPQLMAEAKVPGLGIARYMYSGEGYSYLQSVVAHITGQPLDVYMKANLFVPFDMTSSDFAMTAKLRRHAARPHDEKGTPLDVNTPTGESIARYGAAGGLSTTPSDYARFIIEVVSPKASDPFRLTKASLDDMLRPHVKVNDAMGSSWALGWQVQKTGVINHGGHNRGFQCHAVASAATRSGFVVMTNGEAGAGLLEKLLLSDVTNRLL
jgi:CubicO group peptidase (beta-lactamase class C family)